MIFRFIRRSLMTLLLVAAVALYSLGVLRLESANPAIRWIDHGSGWLTRMVVAQGNGGPGDAIHAAADWLEGSSFDASETNEDQEG
jgi:hypothetical protein